MSQRTVNCMIKVIRFYQKIAPAWMRKMCRFTPSCSEYAIIVLREKGVLKGLLLAFARILRCVPPFGGTDWPESRNNNCHHMKTCKNS